MRNQIFSNELFYLFAILFTWQNYTLECIIMNRFTIMILMTITAGPRAVVLADNAVRPIVLVLSCPVTNI